MSIYYEDCFSLTTKYLRTIASLVDGQLSYTDLEFLSNGERYKLRLVASITDSPILILQYAYGGSLYRVNIELSEQFHNFGGKSYKFICPISGKGCYKLYFINGVVASKGHFKLLHRSQIRSSRIKFMDKRYGIIFKAEKAERIIYSKHFKRYHAGKITKRYAKLLDVIAKAEGISIQGILDQ